MRASVFIATSLDGFIAREDGGIDWLPAGGGEEHGYTAFIESVDVHVIGRNTFETVLGFGGWAYGKKPVVVLSTRPYKKPHPKNAVLEFMEGEPQKIVDQLNQRGFRHAYVDGGKTIQRFLEAGLIQRMTVTRVPVLLGSGIPLFGRLSRDVRLEHLGTRSYASGLVTSEYEVMR